MVGFIIERSVIKMPFDFLDREARRQAERQMIVPALVWFASVLIGSSVIQGMNLNLFGIDPRIGGAYRSASAFVVILPIAVCSAGVIAYQRRAMLGGVELAFYWSAQCSPFLVWATSSRSRNRYPTTLAHTT